MTHTENKIRIPLDPAFIKYIVTFILAVFALGSAWATLKYSISSLETKVETQGQQIAEMKGIQADVSYIKGQIDLLVKKENNRGRR